MSQLGRDRERVAFFYLFWFFFHSTHGPLYLVEERGDFLVVARGHPKGADLVNELAVGRSDNGIDELCT